MTEDRSKNSSFPGRLQIVAVKMSVVKCKLPMLLWLPRYMFKSSAFEYIWSVDLDSLYYDVNAKLILLVYIPPCHIIFKDTFWLTIAVCIGEQIATSYLSRRPWWTNPRKHTFVAFMLMYVI